MLNVVVTKIISRFRLDLELEKAIDTKCTISNFVLIEKNSFTYKNTLIKYLKRR